MPGTGLWIRWGDRGEKDGTSSTYLRIMNIHKPILMACFVVLVTACRKESGNDRPVAPPSHSCGVFEGVTRRDVTGALIPPPDTTDWRTTDNWCPEIEALFPPITGLTWAAELDSSMVMGFPNPTGSSFALHLDNDTTTHADVRIVRQNLQVLHQMDSMTASLYAFHMDSLGLMPGELFRVYYRIVNTDGTAHRGHGDMRYQQ